MLYFLPTTAGLLDYYTSSVSADYYNPYQTPAVPLTHYVPGSSTGTPSPRGFENNNGIGYWGQPTDPTYAQVLDYL